MSEQNKDIIVKVKSVPRGYRIKIEIEEALVKSGVNKNKLVNDLLEKHLKEKGLL